MRSALSLVWVAPGHDQRPPSGGEQSHRVGDDHPTPTTLLIVEDEVLVRLAVSDYLRAQGYRVLEAARAEEAQAIFRTGEPIELMFSDVHLGAGMDGFELCYWVRENYPSVRLLLTSGVTQVSADALRLSDGEFFAKPYLHQLLNIEIRRLIGRLGKAKN